MTGFLHVSDDVSTVIHKYGTVTSFIVQKVPPLIMPSDSFSENWSAEVGSGFVAIPLSLMYITDCNYSTTAP